MTTQELLAVIQLGVSEIPNFKTLWDKIAANSSGTVRPIDQILAEANTNFDDVIATAKAELAQAGETPQS